MTSTGSSKSTYYTLPRLFCNIQNRFYPYDLFYPIVGNPKDAGAVEQAFVEKSTLAAEREEQDECCSSTHTIATPNSSAPEHSRLLRRLV